MYSMHSRFLHVALEAAHAGALVIKQYYRGSLAVHLKADHTPVTIADVEAERTIKGILQAAFPDHGFYGEETGQDHLDAEYRWLIDPIDGTKSFVRAYPFFSTQIALMKGDELIVGVSNAPLFGELAYAERGGGAFLNEQPVRVSAIDTVDEATLSLGNIKTLAGDHRWQALATLVQTVNRTRGYGDFYHYHLLAAGKIDVVVESDVNILDVAALSVIVQEAGGCITDLKGQPLTLATRDILASNPSLHPQVLTALA